MTIRTLAGGGGVLITALTLALASDPYPATKPTASKSTKQKISFQQGVNGYAGTVDLEIWAVSPNTCLEGNINASSDADNDGGESQILMRFDDLLGTAPGRIPPNAAVHSATLIVSAFD